MNWNWLSLYPRLLARLLAAYATGRSHGCPPREAWRALRRKVGRHRVWLALRASASIVEQEEELTLWEIAGERWWTPRESRVLPGLLEERDSGMYDRDPAPGPGDIVLDCGAHIGTFAASALPKGAARVITVEPAPANLECLRRNLAGPIAEGRVTLVPGGVWDCETVGVLRTLPHNPAADSVALALRGSRAGPEVQLITIDALVDRLDLPRVDYLKLDVEGAERQALAGARRTLERWRPALAVAVEHYPTDPEEIPELVRSLLPEYRMLRGPWVLDRWSLRPQLLYFTVSRAS